MPWRSRLIASTRSSRSVTSVVCWVSTSRNSSSARRLTAPSRSRSRLSFSSSASISAMSGSGVSAVEAGEARERLRLGLQDLADLGGEVGEPPLDALVTLLRARCRFACRRKGVMGGAGRAVGLGQGALRRPPAFRRRRAAPSRRLDLGDQRAALCFELLPACRRGRHARCGSRRGAPRWSRSVPRRLPARLVQAAASDAIAARRRSASSISRASAWASARTSASRPRSAATVVRVSASSASSAAEGERSSSACAAVARASCVSASVVVTRAWASARADRRDVMRFNSRSAAAWRSRAASASRCVARQRLRAAFSASPRRRHFRFGHGHRIAARIEIDPHDAQLRLDVGEAVAAGEAAGRTGRRMGGDGKAVPAPQVAFLRHQPLAGLEIAREARAVGTGDDADLRQPARHRVGRRGDEGRAAARRLRAAPDRRHRPARRPNASAPSARPARRDRRRARRRARSRSPFRP